MNNPDTPYNPAAAFVREGESNRHPVLHLRTMAMPVDWTGETTWGWTDVGRERTYAIYAARPDEDSVQVFECRRRQDLEAALGVFAVTGAVIREARNRAA